MIFAKVSSHMTSTISIGKIGIEKKLREVKNFPVKSIDSFKAMAKLLLIPELNGQFCEALYKNGRTTLKKLATPDPVTILKELDLSKEEGVIPENTTLSKIIRWQKNALTIEYNGMISGIVLHNEIPIPDAKIYIAEQKAVTDKEGKFFVAAIPYKSQKIIINADGFLRKEVTIQSFQDFIPNFTFNMKKGEISHEVHDEKKGDHIRKFSADDKIQFVNISLEEVAQETPFLLRHFYKNGNVRLIGVQRKKIGNTIEIDRLIIPENMIEKNGTIGGVFILKNNEFIKSDKSLKDFRKSILLNKFKGKLTLAPIKKLI
ncbi:MAG: carboxypeptidase-like regulatory domain-containing protein [bacterium]|nr:carboxypeptidase-like regulatory domain-containing protein [bacterium]